MSSVGLPKLLLLLLAVPLVRPMIALGALTMSEEPVDFSKAIEMLEEQRGVTVHRPLGYGDFCKVVLGETSDGEKRAFKLCPMGKLLTDLGIRDFSDIFSSEVELMKLAKSSESVVRYYDHFVLPRLPFVQCFFNLFFPCAVTEEFGVIEMEWMRGRDLFCFLDLKRKGQKKDFLSKMALWLLGNAAVSIHKMHQKGVHHYDMRLENLLVDAIPHPEQPDKLEVRRVVVSDFEMAGTSPGPIGSDASLSQRDFHRFCHEAMVFGQEFEMSALQTISKACVKRFDDVRAQAVVCTLNEKIPKEIQEEIIQEKIQARIQARIQAENELKIVSDFKKAAEEHEVPLHQNLLIPWPQKFEREDDGASCDAREDDGETKKIAEAKTEVAEERPKIMEAEINNDEKKRSAVEKGTDANAEYKRAERKS